MLVNDRRTEKDNIESSKRPKFSKSTPEKELGEALLDLKLRQGCSKEESVRFVDAALRFSKADEKLMKEVLKILNEEGKYESFLVVLFTANGHETPCKILKFFRTMDIKMKKGHLVDWKTYWAY